jgi:hypothetical protein
MIIQEMQRDSQFKLESEQKVKHRPRIHTLTESDLDKIPIQSMESELPKVPPQYQILAESKHPRNFRLDSRINPRKSIILDISILDAQGFPTPAHHTSTQLYTSNKRDSWKVRECLTVKRSRRNLLPVISKERTPNRYILKDAHRRQTVRDKYMQGHADGRWPSIK